MRVTESDGRPLVLRGVPAAGAARGAGRWCCAGRRPLVLRGVPAAGAARGAGGGLCGDAEAEGRGEAGGEGGAAAGGAVAGHLRSPP
jgi:hypothetical protein